MVTHDERVAATADRVVSLRDGRLADDTRLDGPGHGHGGGHGHGYGHGGGTGLGALLGRED
ncbi:hypothetical protein ACFU76_13085 [Streptomyces sp. NPDC057539]|uniref:hypothetical protein n=1 Tax=Streptomyces sp. NPDC057539 TaxID=3346159 RepID=UPI0036D0312A